MFRADRSGRGVGLVIPTLLTWPGSLSCSRYQRREIKGENWNLT
ncbi:MAG: Coupling protein VirD4, ATPase required for T-DNA transfer [Afipia sp.]|nr:MAG: Coupling protein VirD4, ATPase required for T-DNA transfer [Afipia sp.]